MAHQERIQAGCIPVLQFELESPWSDSASHKRCVVHDRDLVDVPGACGDGELVPTHAWIPRAIRPDIALLAVHGQDLHVVLEGQPGEVRHRERLEAQVVEVVVGREEFDVGEVFGRLEDARDLEAGLGGIVERGGRRAAGEALELDRAAGVEERSGAEGMVR
jgi:hypothetical protein